MGIHRYGVGMISPRNHRSTAVALKVLDMCRMSLVEATLVSLRTRHMRKYILRNYDLSNQTAATLAFKTLCDADDVEMLKYLVPKMAKIQYHFVATTFMVMSRLGNLSTMKWLDSYFHIYDTAIVVSFDSACQEGQLEVCKWLYPRVSSVCFKWQYLFPRWIQRFLPKPAGNQSVMEDILADEPTEGRRETVKWLRKKYSYPIN